MGFKRFIAAVLVFVLAFANGPFVMGRAISKEEAKSLTKGIDVSYYNGDVNYKSVADQGYTSVMIRLGAGQSYTDPTFSNNYTAAKNAGLLRGAYYYSYATTVEQAMAEAERTLDLLDGRKLEFPVAFDIEEESAFETGMENCTAMVKAYCDIIKQAGYDPCVYASRDKLVNFIDYEQISGYKIWIANYECDYPDYPHPYWMWQYQHTSVPGANTQGGDCDQNIYYGEEFVEASEVTVSETNLEFKLGDDESYVKEADLTASVGPDNASNKHINWYSEDENIATVDQNGHITAVDNGTVNIVASSVNGVEGKCEVTVKTPSTAIEIVNEDLTIGKGETFSLSASLTPPNSTDGFYCKSSDEKVVYVNEDGTLTGKKKGEATITVTTDSGVTTEVVVTVKKAPWRVYHNKIIKFVNKGDTYNMDIKLPKNSASNYIDYYSRNTKIATIDEKGNIKAKKEGWVLIKAEAFNGKRTWTLLIVE
ncbi:MAG: Ig-like domain-containing protein [Lachnospiraceae bacterium]|nr:Ig-like domain-containing protein [Lachnospiraceae bacterium]